MKKTNKPNPLKVFNDNKVAAYKKAGGAMKEFKKSLPKAQTGKPMPPKGQRTPFQAYMKDVPGAVASDTLVKTTYETPEALKKARTTGDSSRYFDKPAAPKAKNPKNQAALNKAFDKTYGEGWYSQQPVSKDETIEEYMRRMGPSNINRYKKGGAIKKKMAAGGSSDSDCWPGKPGCGAEKARRVNKRRRFWNSDAGKTVKKVGAGVAAAGAGTAAYLKNAFGVKDAIKGLSEQKKGGSVKRKK